MTKRNLFTAAAAVACLAQPALAQDAGSSFDDTRGTATSANDDWTGFYVGGRIGISNSRNDDDEQIEFDTNLDGSFGDTVRVGNATTGANAFSPGFCGGRALGPARTSTVKDCNPDGVETEWGVHAGFDYDFGALVAGVVGEFSRSGFEDSVSAFSTTPANYVLTRQLRDSFGLRARAGLDLDGTLIYATGGGVYGKVRNRLRTSNTANAFTVSPSDQEFGYRVGGGVERKINNFSIGAQYLFTSIEPDAATVRVARGSAPATNPFILTNANGTDFRRTEDKFENHNISVTASLRF